MAATVKLAVHLVIFIIDLYTTYYDLFILEVGSKGFGGKFKFLTCWCIVLQTIYFGLAVLIDLTEKTQNPSNPAQRNGLQKFRDIFHSCVAFPIAMFVGATFWLLYAVDRELVYPKALDSVIPVWINHLLHTTIVPFIIMDKFVTRHHYPRMLFGLLGACGLSLIYLIWILIVAYVDNFWVYPVLQNMRTHERAVFIAVCLAFFSSFYIVGESLTKFIWAARKNKSAKASAQRISKKK